MVTDEDLRRLVEVERRYSDLYLGPERMVLQVERFSHYLLRPTLDDVVNPPHRARCQMIDSRGRPGFAILARGRSP